MTLSKVILFILCSELSKFVEQNEDTKIFAAVESTGGYENNWINLLIRLQNSLPIQAARLNPLGVHANSKAGLQRIITLQIRSAQKTLQNTWSLIQKKLIIKLQMENLQVLKNYGSIFKC